MERGSNTLTLTLKRKPFEVMVTSEKMVEFRKPSQWIISRLENPKWKFIEFRNGYRASSPSFKVPYLGYTVAAEDEVERYSNGLEVRIKAGDIIIFLGKVIPYD